MARNPQLNIRNYLSFNVLMDINANMMAMIQKRTITFGSGHPFSSK